MTATPHKSSLPLAGWSSIRYKLIAIIMGVSSMALLVSGTLIVLMQVSAFRERLIGDHVTLTRMVASNCLAAVSFADSADASLVLATLARQDPLLFARVSTADGHVVASYRRDGFTEAPQPSPIPGTSVLSDGWLLATEPIVLEGKIIGTAFLQSDLRELTEFRRRIVTLVAGSLCVVFLLAWGASLGLQSIVSKPVERLTRLVRHISHRGDYSLRAEDAGRDEIGQLASAFNEMLSELALRDRQIEEREQRTRDYLEVARVMIVALDPAAVVTLINPTGCQILRLTESQVVGRSFVDHFVPERRRHHIKSVFASLASGDDRAIQPFESEVLTGTGEERLISWHHSVIRDPEGNQVSVLASGEDITERRASVRREAALREELARAERMKSMGVLAGGVAHDLNNLLGPMLVLPEFIEADLLAAMAGDASAGDQIRRSLQTLRTSADRAASVVQDLMTLSRRGRFDPIPTDVNEMACLKRSSPVIESLRKSHPDIGIVLQRANGKLVIRGSENNLCRAIENLIRNAVESIPGPGTVTVTTSAQQIGETRVGYATVPPGRYAVIQVEDTGCGMDRDDLDRIFEPFYTKKTQTARSGTGLGLSVVHGVVEDHGGYIDVQSQVDRGTAFTLYLPMVEPKEDPRPSNGRSVISGHGRMLVVDDDPGQRLLADRALTKLGYCVDVAEEGRSAVAIFAEATARDKASPYDVVILDMRMETGFDGLDTMREIRKLCPRQRVLIVTGQAEDDRLKAAQDLDAQFLAKPYTLAELAESVDKLFRKQLS